MLIWNIKKSPEEEREKKPYYDIIKLTADPKVYGEELAGIYYNKILCEIAANGDYFAFRKLYYEECQSSVWEYLTVKKAVNY